MASDDFENTKKYLAERPIWESIDVKRLFIRSARIFAGLMLALISIWPFDYCSDVADVPFSRLTLHMLGSSLFAAVFGMGLLWGAFHTAFGAAPENVPSSPQR